MRVAGKWVGLGLAVVEILSGIRLGDLGGTLANAMFVLPNSRENEQEADLIGIELAARAQEIEHGVAPRLDDEVFREELIAMIAAILAAPYRGEPAVERG